MNLSVRLMFATTCLSLLALTGCMDSGGSSSATPDNSQSAVLAGSSGSSAGLTVAGGAPGLVASSRTGSVDIVWNAVAGATSYRIYYASEPGIQPQNISIYQDGKVYQNVRSPFRKTGLINNQVGFFRLTAMVDGQEVLVGNEMAIAARGLEPSVNEVHALELVNRARLDPAAEAARYGINLNDGLPAGTISTQPKQPLAYNADLLLAARAHGEWMLESNTFSHTGEGGSTVRQRIEAAGYQLWAPWIVGENLSWGGTTGNSIDMAGWVAEHHERLFRSPGHRENTMNDRFRELGASQLRGYFRHQGTNYLTSMMTQKFAASSGRVFLTGVVYEDRTGNGRFQPQLARNDVMIKVNGYYWRPYQSGAYAIPLGTGTHRVEVIADNGVTTSFDVSIAGRNLKRDLVFRQGVLSSRSF
ncbi:MAG: CAP domain-containing protein [Marinobacter sp.]|nr:CAP domain-containing protein [Marinobacter sp.]